MVNIKLIPTWVWVAIPLIALLVVGVRQSMRAAYYRGIANDAEQRIEIQKIILDSIIILSDSLTVALEKADSAVAEQRLEAEREVARLTRTREEERERTEVISANLRASLDSAQAIELDDIVIGYENQIASLHSIIEVERETQMAEALRADRASELILGLREVIAEHESKDLIQALEVDALRESMKFSLGLRLKADWWLAVTCLVGGFLLWGL